MGWREAPKSMAQEYPVWNPVDSVWQGPDGSKTMGSGPTWINPNGKRQGNFDNGPVITDSNQIKAGWREAPKSLAIPSNPD